MTTKGQTPDPKNTDTELGSEWADWGARDADGEDRWKASAHVGALVRLTLRGYKEVDTTYGLWQFVEADVEVFTDDGKRVDLYPETAISNAWFVRRFKAAPSGYQAIGVITSEEFAKGTGYAMRVVTPDELDIVRNAVPTY